MRHLRRQARPGWRRSGGATADSFPLGGEAPAAEFPANIRAHVQYGDSVCVLAGLLSPYGAVSAGRIHTLPGSLMGVGLSTGTISAMVSRCASKVGGTLAATKAMLTKEGVVHFDETGTDVNGKTAWGTARPQRSSPARRSAPGGARRAWGRTECCPTSGAWQCTTAGGHAGNTNCPGHAVCCAHLLRELTGIEEFSPGHGWASRLKAPLMDMKRTKGRTMARGEDAIPRKAEVRCGIRPDPGGGRAVCPPPRTGGGEGRGRERNGLSSSA